jgi:AcrR family transcriptional regulator
VRDYQGKTGEERRAERRRKLMTAGIEVFAERGYANTTIRAILARAGLQDRYFGESFPNTAALLIAIHDELDDAMLDKVSKAMDPSAPPITRYRQMIRTLVEGFQNQPDATKVKLVEISAAGPLAESHRQRGLDRYADLVADMLPSDGFITDIRTRVLAKAVVAGGNSMFLDWTRNPQSRMSPTELVEHAVLLFEGVVSALRVTGNTCP